MSNNLSQEDLIHQREDFGHGGQASQNEEHMPGPNPAVSKQEAIQSIFPPFQTNISQPSSDETLPNQEAKGGKTPRENFGYGGYVQQQEEHMPGHNPAVSNQEATQQAIQSILPPFQANIPQPSINERLRNPNAEGGEAPLEDFGYGGQSQQNEEYIPGHDPAVLKQEATQPVIQSIFPPFQANIPQPSFNEKLRNPNAIGGETPLEDFGSGGQSQQNEAHTPGHDPTFSKQ